MKDNVLIAESGTTAAKCDARWVEDSDDDFFEPTPRFDLIVRGPSHRHGATKVSGDVQIAVNDNGGAIYELIDDDVRGREEDDET